MFQGNLQLTLRTSYAERRRHGVFRTTKRVIWKTKSKHIA